MSYREAFTVDAPGIKIRDDAISIQQCNDHKDRKCKEIGIHITAVAHLEEPQHRVKLPTYCGEKHLNYRIKPKYSLDSKKRTDRSVVSVFLHSSDNDAVTGPVLSKIRVTRNHSFEDRELEDMLDPVWLAVIGENKSQMLHKRNFRYVANHPEYGRFALLIDEIMSVFNQQVTKYIRTHSKQCYFITKELQNDLPLRKQMAACVFRDQFDEAANQFWSESQGDMALVKLVSSGRRSHLPWQKNTTYFPLRYQVDIQSGSEIGELEVVQCASPLTNFHDFLNQQILCSSLNGLDKVCTKNELLGRTVVRFQKPRLAKPVVQIVAKEMMKLYYPAVWNYAAFPTGLSELPWKFLSDQIPVVENEKAIIHMKNIKCSHNLCNRELLHLDSSLFDDFYELFEIGTSVSDSTMKQKLFERMCKTKEAQEKTYKRTEEGMLLTFQRSTELQIQISERDAAKIPSMGCRLLRIGENCHLCFTHIHHPEMAFMSDRKDVRQLVNDAAIDGLKNQKIEDKLASEKLLDVKISWDSYESGGSLVTDQYAAVGDFLCIRKEIAMESEVLYVWTCHAIVSQVNGSTLKFSTCTLSQDEQHPGKDGYFVEIIKKQK